MQYLNFNKFEYHYFLYFPFKSEDGYSDANWTDQWSMKYCGPIYPIVYSSVNLVFIYNAFTIMYLSHVLLGECYSVSNSYSDIKRRVWFTIQLLTYEHYIGDEQLIVNHGKCETSRKLQLY